MTNFKADQISVTAHTLISTNPSGSATSRIVSSVISVETFDDLFGHDTHTAASGLIDLRSLSSSAAIRAFWRLNRWMIPVSLDRRFSNTTPSGNGARRWR